MTPPSSLQSDFDISTDERFAHLFNPRTDSIDAVLSKMDLAPGVLKDQRVLLLGSGRGIGLHTMLGLLYLGATVTAIDIRMPEQTLDMLSKSVYRDQIHFLNLDLADASNALRACSEAEVLMGGVDILINNVAHIHPAQPFHELDMGEWEECFAVTTRAPLLATKQVLSSMMEQKRGVIIYQMADEGSPFWSGYSASKSALKSLSLSLAAETPVESGVHVFSFAPGLVATQLVADRSVPLMEKMGKDFEEFVTESAVNTGYPGMIPAQHAAATLIHSIIHSEQHHGSLANGHKVLQEANLAPLKVDIPDASPDDEIPYLSAKDAHETEGDVSQRIEDQVQIRTRELEDREEELQAQKLESLGVLASGIAHDFNNLLVGMNANIEMAIEDSNEETSELLKDALEAAVKASELVRSMLDYSGKGHFKLKEIDLNDTVNVTIRLLKGSISPDIKLELDLCDSEALLRVDPGQMQQLIMNLALNAAEAVEDEGKVLVRTSCITLDQSEAASFSNLSHTLEPGQYVVLEVHDDGAGIDPEKINDIFDPFYSTKFTGRGLGLSAAHGIVKGHQGGIRLESELEKGTAIFVALPIRDIEQPVVEEPAKDAQPGAVLVIDDDPMIRKTLEKILQRSDVVPLLADGGKSGIDLMMEHRENVRLILLDLCMPEMDGEETLREVLKHEPNMPVVLMSGFTEKDTAKNFKDLGFKQFMPKPFEINKIRSLVEQYVA